MLCYDVDKLLYCVFFSIVCLTPETGRCFLVLPVLWSPVATCKQRLQLQALDSLVVTGPLQGTLPINGRKERF